MYGQYWSLSNGEMCLMIIRDHSKDVIAKMLNFRAPFPYVTVSHVFHYILSPYVTRQIVTNFVLEQTP